jgi:D-3-phosphoglycerate dehydrogenase
MKKILIATEKPFAPAAVAQIREIAKSNGYEFALLEKYSSAQELKTAVSDVNALIVRSDKVSADIIDAAKELEIVVRAGAGYDNLDLEACSSKSVVAMNTPGQNSNAVGELAVGMMVFQARNQYNGTAGTELRGKALGIHAYGNVGAYVAQIAKGFGMDVYAFDPFVSSEKIKADGVKPLKSMEELYQTPDNKSVFEEKFQGRFFFTPKKMGAQTAEANINSGVAAANQIVNYLQNGDETFRVNK